MVYLVMVMAGVFLLCWRAQILARVARLWHVVKLPNFFSDGDG